MFSAAGMTPIGALVALLVLVIWIIALVWVAARIQAFVARKTGWQSLYWGNLLCTFLLLVAAIHLGNFVLDLFDRWTNGADYPIRMDFPGSFLIGSVAIGVGIAAVRSNRGK